MAMFSLEIPAISAGKQTLTTTKAICLLSKRVDPSQVIQLFLFLKYLKVFANFSETSKKLVVVGDGGCGMLDKYR